VSSRVCVLIDDDFLVHMTWKMTSDKSGIVLFAFYSENEFLTQIGNIPLSSEIYIDKNLGQGIDGVEVAGRVAKLGFQNIFLATGSDYLIEEIQNQFPFIKGVIGKSPPFG
jgi:hypothetical protein